MVQMASPDKDKCFSFLSFSRLPFIFMIIMLHKCFYDLPYDVKI